ncbi:MULTISPECIES: GNAT family N-acetyltransferase [Paraburkholderia]|uniref:GNAT family N-acetyltransferase n=1 Tax=Paraburkholderia TaxID=1822464 RepID=UPI00225AEB4C|nr:MULTISPECIES: GNAT family N-acetyltransferase [Paraburkholderia]MCX4163696.1 GNAT family N-acetyltransferase [Paraburkholderia megapolitana]MDN7159191.1 GNAT family N-acetyltransferase [Paraburkholderia sp. CHISQ3]MDQ6496238.1 GNAT family N-acetyltransferase [Paraburkholderia megapolitana]
MRDDAKTIEILTGYSDVAPFVPTITKAADSEKNALGFFPSSVFEEFARKEQLFVATLRRSDKMTYAGHLLFDARHPKAHVLQMYVAPVFRKQGIASFLLNSLKDHLTEHAFISLYARVAEDLVEANDFWHRQNFYVQRVAPGGVTKKRTILVRSHELDTPQLIAPSGLTAANPLGLESVVSPEIPLFLLDLNVLFDLGPRRRRNEDVLELFRAERMRSCRLALSTEISAELSRTATVGRTDPMQVYARIFPTFPCPSAEDWDTLAVNLAPTVFLDRFRANSLTKNDISDLRHLATAIHHKLAGLITNDRSILDAAVALKDRYGIEVISPAAFQDLTSPGIAGEVFETTSSDTLSLTTITGTDEPAVYRLLSKLDVHASSLASDWAAVDAGERVCVRRGVWSEGNLVGYVTWPKGLSKSSITAHIAVDESGPNALNATRALLSELVEQSSGVDATQIRLEFPRHQSRVREVAAALGFTGIPGQSSLSKLTLGRLITDENWSECRSSLLSVGRLKLPDALPLFSNVDQQIKLFRPDGNLVHVSLMTLETLLAPALFCLPGRPALITPVRRGFAEHLLTHLPQRSLLPLARAALYREKHYLSDKRTLKHFNRGALVLFYESGKDRGLSAIVAIARVQHAYLKSQDAMEDADLDPSVLDTAGLEAIGRSKIKTVTVFDNLIRFSRPVPLETLRALGCGSATNLVTTHQINDSQLQEIVSRGFAHG